MKTSLLVVTVLMAVPASAERLHLLDASASSLFPEAVRSASLQGLAHDTGTNLFMIGLGLAAGGLVVGGAGFAVLYACREGTTCHNRDTTVLGWVLAAPGVILVAGW